MFDCAYDLSLIGRVRGQAGAPVLDERARVGPGRDGADGVEPEPTLLIPAHQELHGRLDRHPGNRSANLDYQVIVACRLSRDSCASTCRLVERPGPDSGGQVRRRARVAARGARADPRLRPSRNRLAPRLAPHHHRHHRQPISLRRLRTGQHLCFVLRSALLIRRTLRYTYVRVEVVRLV